MNPYAFSARWGHLAASLILAASPVAASTRPPDPPEAAAKAPALSWGDPAPALKVSRWVKGRPVKALEPGEIYVVEFWATWCSPCREAIPHLTKLARQFAGKVTFIGVDVWEKGRDEAAIDKKVDAFVKEMGDRMDYHICRDSQDGHMARAWMSASGQGGIPAAFIVDKAGRVAWTGSPHDLEKTLKAVIAGTYDSKRTAAAIAAEEREARSRAETTAAVLAELAPAFRKAMDAKDWPGALALVDAAEARHPGVAALKSRLLGLRIQSLAVPEPAKAEALLEAGLVNPTVEDYGFAIEVLFELRGLGRHWSELGLKYLDQVRKLNPETADVLPALRFAFMMCLDPGKASALFEAEKRNPMSIYRLCESILTLKSEKRVWLEGLATALEPLQRDPEAFYLTGSYAETLFQLGQVQEAVACQERLMRILKATKVPEEYRQKSEENLRIFSAGLK